MSSPFLSSWLEPQTSRLRVQQALHSTIGAKILNLSLTFSLKKKLYVKPPVN